MSRTTRWRSPSSAIASATCRPGSVGRGSLSGDRAPALDLARGGEHTPPILAGNLDPRERRPPMKFMLFVLPTVPGTLDDRTRLRPIGRNNEPYQQMLDELRKLAGVADDPGLDR